MKNRKIFLIEIELEESQWDGLYNKSQRLTIPVKSNSWYNAERKFLNKKSGSEFPEYRIIDYKICDNFLFSPIL